jgi:hypothetical protein
MAKGYWIARVDVRNMDGYKEYVAQNGAVFNKYGGTFLVRGGKFEEGRLVAVAQCGAGIQGLRNRARLLQFAGICAARSAHPMPRATS